MDTQRHDIAGRRHEIIAAFDIGSNSIKLTVAKEGRNGIDEFAWRSETVRLGEGVDETHELAPDRIEAAIAALKQFTEFAKERGATRLIGVATEATRIASNGAEFLERVARETGIEIDSISGDREAELTFLGLNGVIDPSGDVIVADIGGGSTEIIAATDGEIRFSKSYPVGSGRLTDRFVRDDPPSTSELEACRTFAREILKDAPISGREQARLYITGGAGEYSFRLIPEGIRANALIVDGLLRELKTKTAAEVAAQLTIPKARARVLPAGVAVIRAVIDLTDPSSVQAAQSGIRRGLLLAAFAGTI